MPSSASSRFTSRPPSLTEGRSSGARSSCVSWWSCWNKGTRPKPSSPSGERVSRWRERTNGAARFRRTMSLHRWTTRSAAAATPTAMQLASSASLCRGSWTAFFGDRATIVAVREGSPLRIVLVGEESAGMRVLRALASGAHTVVAVLAEQRPTEQESVSALAKRLGLPVWPPDLVRNPELADTLHRERIDVLVNVHSLQLVAAEVLAAPSSAASTSTLGHCRATQASIRRAGRSTTANVATAPPCTG